MRIVQLWMGCGLTLALYASGTLGAVARDSGQASTHPVIEAFLSNAQVPLVRYRALRTLEAATRGGRMRATLKAWTSLSPEEGFQYSVVEETGSALIRNKVLRAALAAEQEINRQPPDTQGAISLANYDFSFAGEADEGLVRINIRPKRREKMLIDGSLLVSGLDSDLVQVEGALVKRPSFWTRHVDVVRRYARLAGVRVPVVMRSTASVLITGTSTFEMTYRYEQVNGEAVP